MVKHMSLTNKQNLRTLDRRLAALREALLAPGKVTPSEGWVRTLRQALGMSAQQLAQRLGMTRQGLVQLERGERNQQISLSSLRRAAEALDAELVYAIVPRKPIQQTLNERARALARARTTRVAQSMRLEEQGISDSEEEQQITDYANELLKRPRDLWR